MAASPQLSINSERLRTDFDELAEIGATMGGGVSRLALSNEDLEARAWFANRVEEAGLLVRDDEVGNLSGILPSQNPSAKTLLVGSHLDTVPNGGHYDGTIGVLAGLECLRTIREAALNLPHHLEVINFTDEEGSWQSFFGSLGLTGALAGIQANYERGDSSAFKATLFRAGISPMEVKRAARNPDDIAAFVELHIEQGRRLEQEAVDIGIVSGIVGRSTIKFTFYGTATHAATTEFTERRDALRTAAIFIAQLYDAIQPQYPAGRVNCGELRVSPGRHNVIPSDVTVFVETRHPQQAFLEAMQSDVIRLAQEIAKGMNTTVGSAVMLKRPVAAMSEAISQAIMQACACYGYSHMPLTSYAGHDAQILSHFTPSGLIFIPSHRGVSHHPKEFSDWSHVEQGANVLLQTLLQLSDL
jgi:beta-ureidopropionase / N-carbamoyl-L-amino-acid hydrolase